MKSQREIIAQLEAEKSELLNRIETLRRALLPFAVIGRGLTAEQIAGDASGWLAHAKWASEVAFGKQVKGARAA